MGPASSIHPGKDLLVEEGAAWPRALSWPPPLSADHSLPWWRTPLVDEDNLTRGFPRALGLSLRNQQRGQHCAPQQAPAWLWGDTGWVLEEQSWLRPALSKCSEASAIRPDWVVTSPP